MPTKYNRELAEKAIANFYKSPLTLADEEIEQLSLLDLHLGERARATRAGYVAVKSSSDEQVDAAPLPTGAFLSWIEDYFGPTLATYRVRIDELEQRITDLEARPAGPEYKGVFTAGDVYPRGVLVTKKGGLWLSLKETVAPPGASPGEWKLIVKSGQVEP